MGSDSGKYIIPFGVIVLVLNVLLILVLIFQDYLVPKPAVVVPDEDIISAPLSFPVSFIE